MPRKKSNLENHLKAKRARKRAALQIKKRSLKSSAPRGFEPHHLKAAAGKSYLAVRTFAEVEGEKAIGLWNGLIGCGFSQEVIASNRAESQLLERDTWRYVKRLTAEDGMEFAFQSAVLDRTDGSSPVFDLKKIRTRFPQTYNKAGASGFGGLTLNDVPDDQDDSGFSIETTHDSLLYGRNLKQAISIWQAAKPSASRVTAKLRWISGPDEIRDALKQVIAPPMIGSAHSRSAAAAAGVQNWMRRPAKRALVLFQANSMLLMKHRLFAYGDAEPVLSSALAGSASRVKQSSKGSPVTFRRDELIHFWFAENKRMQLDLVPPLWLYR